MIGNELAHHSNAVFVVQVGQVVAGGIRTNSCVPFVVENSTQEKAALLVPCTVAGEQCMVRIGRVTEVREGRHHADLIILDFAVAGLAGYAQPTGAAVTESGEGEPFFRDARLLGRDVDIETVAAGRHGNRLARVVQFTCFQIVAVVVQIGPNAEFLACVGPIAVDIEVHPGIDPAVLRCGQGKSHVIVAAGTAAQQKVGVEHDTVVVHVTAGGRVGSGVGFIVHAGSELESARHQMPGSVAIQERGIIGGVVGVVRRIAKVEARDRDRKHGHAVERAAESVDRHYVVGPVAHTDNRIVNHDRILGLRPNSRRWNQVDYVVRGVVIEEVVGPFH